MVENCGSVLERRSGFDRRKTYRLGFFTKSRKKGRKVKEQRVSRERRHGWVRVGKWSSVRLKGLMIAKFLKGTQQLKNRDDKLRALSNRKRKIEDEGVSQLTAFSFRNHI
jgi:hypothetical protein